MGMTTNEAIEILIAVAVCDRPILSCDFCARYVGMGTDCTYPHDGEIEEAVLLLKGASKDMAISALRQQERFGEVTKKVEPLTLDDLREAAQTGDPVWLVRANCSSWVVIEKVDDRKYIQLVDYAEFGSDEPYDFAISDYGESFKAYRQKPEEGAI